MKAETIGVKLTSVYKGFSERVNSEDIGISPIIIHDEHRIQ